MMLQERRILDDVLAADEPCLGAVFCTYTFDPAYFEEHVLRTLLRLQGDPDEDAARYHFEARTALQETPVACIVDASVRRAGRRLPYDLLLVRERTFHPKFILALYAEDARLMIGSGNLTRPGLAQNTELFFCRRLRYDDARGASLLRQAEGFLSQAVGLATHPGTQLGLVRDELARRLKHGAAPIETAGNDVQLVSSFQAPLLQQIDRTIPAEAQIVRVGVLAPFFEQDDGSAADDEEGFGSVLRTLAAMRPGREVVMDVGVPWEDAPLAPGPEIAPLDPGAGTLWALRSAHSNGDGQTHNIEYFAIDSIGPRTVSCRDARGQGRRLDRETLELAASERRLWPIRRIQVFAPKRILQRLAKDHGLQLWLHPAASLSPSGRPSRRPLHAKLFLVTFRHRRALQTLVLLGSPNASRAALGRPVENGGNVESGILALVEGELSLPDVLPSLVRVDAERLECLERQFPAALPDLSAWIVDAVHEVVANSLEILWAAQGPAPLGHWTLSYDDRELARGEGPSPAPTFIHPFTLSRGTAELTLTTAEGEWSVPIRIADLAALPVSPLLAELDLRELLALLGRRVGAERIEGLRADRGAAGSSAALEAIFGEGFSPTDVFKAWWGVAEDLAGPLSLAGFRHRLFGPMGLRTVWERLREAIGKGVSQDEAWVYGCELLRTLSAISVLPGADAAPKQLLLGEACAALRTELDSLCPSSTEHPWLKAVTRFYGMESADA